MKPFNPGLRIVLMIFIGKPREIVQDRLKDDVENLI